MSHVRLRRRPFLEVVAYWDGVKFALESIRKDPGALEMLDRAFKLSHDMLREQIEGTSDIVEPRGLMNWKCEKELEPGEECWCGLGCGSDLDGPAFASKSIGDDFKRGLGRPLERGGIDP